MIIPLPKNFFTVGIFADAKENLENFNYNIYLTYMMQDSVDRRAKMQEAYEKALRQRDPTLLEDLKKELELFDNSFALTAAMLNQFHDEN
jgi:hypothetical protein|tara:strand:+ start:411 stop:680 length:270 start_codon:yes stop_codon:yes gene_type:complete